MLPGWLGISIAFVYGIAIGSFLNVCIYRLPAEESIVHPPSHCPKCNTRLRGVDLVPLFSFLLLGRRCRYCKTPISWRYFGVELLTGLLYVATYLSHGVSVDTFVYIAFISAMLVAFFVDIDHLIIPDQVVILGLLIGIGKDVAHIIAGDAKLISLAPLGLHIPMLPSIVGMVVCAGIFYLISYAAYFAFRPKGSKEEQEEYDEQGGALGGGDISLAAAIGAVVGVQPALVSFFLAVIIGSIVGVTVMIFKARANRKKGMEWRAQIPFGPFMVTGAFAVIFLYPQLQHLWEAWIRLVTM